MVAYLRDLRLPSARGCRRLPLHDRDATPTLVFSPHARCARHWPSGLWGSRDKARAGREGELCLSGWTCCYTPWSRWAMGGNGPRHGPRPSPLEVRRDGVSYGSLRRTACVTWVDGRFAAAARSTIGFDITNIAHRRRRLQCRFAVRPPERHGVRGAPPPRTRAGERGTGSRSRATPTRRLRSPRA